MTAQPTRIPVPLVHRDRLWLLYLLRSAALRILEAAEHHDLEAAKREIHAALNLIERAE